MKRYTTNTKDTCWKDCLGCILEVNPKKVPDFVNLYDDQYFDQTRRWLDSKYGKGLVYVPARNFMETGKMRFNNPVGPAGYSIGFMSGMVGSEDAHAVICFNGGVLWDNGDDRHEDYGVLKGYFVIYDLECPTAKPMRKKSVKRKTKVK